MERSYIAFISYKHTERDSAIAKQVHTLIESYVIPKSLRKDGKKLGIVFRDEEELPISSDLTESICTALDASRYLIVICSPEAKQSPWVAREVNYFLRNHDARNAFVVLADGEPNDVFPYELTHILNQETGEYQEVEPLAMDVRADSIGASLKKAKTYIKKLYAGMLGCSYDSLVQREKTRKMKRIMALATLCVLLAGCFIGVLFVKNRELSQKNDELTAAIELALRRESEVLVEQADEALQEGDVVTALKYASDALYSEDIDRPYYAPAERALFYAADVLREEEDQPLLSKVAMKHRAPIEMMTYSTDGSILYTIDSYGTVSSYDCASGELFWNVKLQDHGDESVIGVKPQLWYDGESGVLACYFDEFLSGLDVSTGQVLWQREFEDTPVGGIFHDVQGQKLAYIETAYTHNWDDMLQSYYDYNFVVYAIADGSELNRITFDGFREKMMDMLTQFGQSGNSLSSGMFTSSDCFVGTVFRKVDDVRKAMLYIIDLSENSVRYIENSGITEDMQYIRTFHIGDDRAVVLSKDYEEDPETGYMESYLRIQGFDVKSGDLLWDNRTKVEKYIITDFNCEIIPRSGSTVLAIGENMFVFDNETGEFKASTTLDAGIIDMNPIADGLLFSFTLENGYCAVGWYNNDNGLIDSKQFSTTIDLPDTSDVAAYNAGLIQVSIKDMAIDSFDFTPVQDGGGRITYLSDDRCTAYVTTVLPAMVLPEQIPVEASNYGLYGVGNFLDVNPQGKALFGLMHLEDGYGLSVMDTENHTLEVIEFDEYLSLYDSKFYLTSDGQHVIDSSKYDDIRILDLDGNISTLFENETITLKVVKDTQLVADKFSSDAARQVSDGRVLIARTDGQTIDIWDEGVEEASVSVPEDVLWSVVDNAYLLADFRVGENGLMVLSDFVSEEEKVIDNFAVYDVASGKWKMIADAVHGPDERMLVFGQDSPVFAVYDEDMKIRVYNYNSASLAHCVDVELPMLSVMKIGMLMEDRYVYVLTKDGQFIIYCIETNEMVLRTTFDSLTSTSAFSNWLDRENHRLYLRAEEDGFCFDVRAWEQLFSAKKFKYFSAASSEAYISEYDWMTGTYSLKAIPIPDTSELINMTLETLY